MKNIGEWIIIKALNKHEELVVKFEDNKFYMAIGIYCSKKDLTVLENSIVVIDNVEELNKLLNNIEKVMSKKDNRIFLYNQMKSQDVFLYLINYNSAFKMRDTLKITLYSYVGVNSSTYKCITISKDSCRNLYKSILIAINKMGGCENI